MSSKSTNMRAILSVSDKTGLADFGRGLADLGVELVSTGGTATALAAAGLPVVGVSDVTGFPEMMDGRVKTLHPAIHAGILARRSRPDDLEAIARHGITPVDLVVVNLYPFAKAAQNPETPFDALVEEIDIGGPSLVRAAAKNFRDVLVVVDPADYPQVLDALRRPGGPDLEFRFKLMQKAFAHTGQYDSMIAVTLQTVEYANGAMTRSAAADASSGTEGPALRGEPAPEGPWVPNQAPFLPPWEIHQGKELSYTNLLDLDAALRIALEFPEPVGVVIKHTNPCGVALGATIADAYVRAREADPLSAFGGIVGLNRTFDVETARALTSTFIEAVIAPDVADEARPILATKANLRVATADFVKLAALDLERARDTRIVPRRRADAGARRGDRSARALAPGRVSEGRHQAGADGGGVDRAALRLARLRPREVERRHLHQRRSHAGRRRRPDEPRRCRQGGGDEGRRHARELGGGVGRVLPVPRRPRRRRRRRRDARSCSPAVRSATPRSSPPPTSAASRWYSRAGDTSGIDT